MKEQESAKSRDRSMSVCRSMLPAGRDVPVPPCLLCNE